MLHPALPGDAGYDLWKRDFKGAAGLFAFVVQPCSETVARTCQVGSDDLVHQGLGKIPAESSLGNRDGLATCNCEFHHHSPQCIFTAGRTEI